MVNWLVFQFPSRCGPSLSKCSLCVRSCSSLFPQTLSFTSCYLTPLTSTSQTDGERGRRLRGRVEASGPQDPVSTSSWIKALTCHNTSTHRPLTLFCRLTHTLYFTPPLIRSYFLQYGLIYRTRRPESDLKCFLTLHSSPSDT